MANKYDPEKIELMKEASEICSKVFYQLVSMVDVGVTGVQIDKKAEELCQREGVTPAFKGFMGYPACINSNINDVVVHGIPDNTPLKDGDIISIDFGIEYIEVFSDMSVTVPVGTVTPEIRDLLDATRKSVMAGIAKALPGNHVGDIGAAMQGVVENAGFSVVREMVGHGIGYDLHEDPYVPGYGQKGQGEELYKGQTLAIEAIVNQGSRHVTISDKDGWTTTTNDGKLSALFEHTVVVDDDPMVLTQW